MAYSGKGNENDIAIKAHLDDARIIVQVVYFTWDKLPELCGCTMNCNLHNISCIV